ncbi:MAG: 2Fe-2S iron-sulfur cluster-binding protein [Azospirillaceae bacterium]|nr:2Fe-2S iron-sulfur cluster-binding protein [Azospirillaceae bacterium]
MPGLTVIHRDGSMGTVEVPAGTTALDAIRLREPDDFFGLCGGGLSCGTCHVYVDGRHFKDLAPPSPQEDRLLGLSQHRQPTSRLSCQIRLTDALDGIRATLAPDD